MPISVFTGPPGAGKSYNLVSDVMLKAYRAGRRVVTNVEGVNPDAFLAFCVNEGDDPAKLGQVLTFDGEAAQQPGFWPQKEDTAEQLAQRFVQAGDLVAFDEWAMYFPPSGKLPDDLEPFMRWHRHLTHPTTGQATDLAIGTQSMTDLHRRIRHLVQKSYAFLKMTALGLNKYTWKQYQAHLQTKGKEVGIGTGAYEPKFFPLYQSSQAAADGTHVELKTSKRESIWSQPKVWVAIAAIVLLPIGGFWTFSNSFLAKSETPQTAVEGSPGPDGQVQAPKPPPAPIYSPWRIVGQVEGDGGRRVIVADEKGGVRMLLPGDFTFDEGRPVRGTVDGQLAVAVDQLPTANQGNGLGIASPFGGELR